MTHLGRATIMLVLGVMTMRLIVTGGFGWFVAQRMRLPLLAAGIVLLVLGAAEYFASTRKQPPAAPSSSDHAQGELPALVVETLAVETQLVDGEVVDTQVLPGRVDDPQHAMAGPKVGWLLVLPLAVLIAVAPTGLGAAAADRVDAFRPTDSGADWPALDTSAGPVDLTMMEFLNRAVWDETRSLEDVTVRLTGIVVNDPDIADGFKLTKFLVSCCAADGLPVQAAVRGATEGYENDTWVEVVGEWIPTDLDSPGATPELRAHSISVMTNPPRDPYESW